jgi:phage protein D
MSPSADTLLAGAEIKLDGTALDPTVAAQLVEVRVDQHLRLPDRAGIRLADPRVELVDNATFALGAEVEIELGAAGGELATVFTGQLVALEPEFSAREAMLVLRAYDRSHSLNRTRQTDMYQEMSYSDIAAQVAQRNGLSAGTIDATETQVAFVQQSNETDWAFLWRLADAIGYEVRVTGRALDFRKASGGGEGDASQTLIWGEALRDFRPRATGMHQIDTVKVHAWDPLQAQQIVGSAQPQTGATSIGVDRAEAAGALGGGTLVIADQPVGTQSEADALAAGIAARIADGFVEADGVADGNPALAAGGKVKIDGVGERFGGTYSLSTAAHVFRSGRGYETRFTVSSRPGRPLMSAGHGPPPRTWRHSVVVGQVTNNDDPEALGRVRVSYAALGAEHEGWWARMTGPMAGGQRGLLMLPQVGDEVLVAFEHDDETRPIVLGAVWAGQQKPQQLAHTDGSLALRSDKEVVVEAADAISITGDKKMTLTAAGGATLTTDAGDGAPGDLSLASKGNAELKANQKVTVDATTDATINGQAKLTLNAGAQLTIEGKGQVTIKGSMLQLQATGIVQISGAQVMLG